MYIHMCVNTLSPAQPSPYIVFRLYICESIQQESHHLAVALLSRYDDRSMPSLSETNSILQRQLLIYIHTYIQTYKHTDLFYMNTHRHCKVLLHHVLL
jgi:hypothetical protein